MTIRQVLGTAALLLMLGAEPPSVQAADSSPGFRFAIVTPRDNPQVIRVVRRTRRGHPYRRVILRPSKKIVWRYV